MTTSPAAILTDIEGTTSSLSFVHETLFPFARKHLPDFIHRHGDDPSIQQHLETAADIAGCDRDADSVIPVLLKWIDEDRKIAPLKSLQGMVWAEGYADGVLKGHIYPDAVTRLRQWHEAGIRLYVYSSGSVQAQRLIFGHTGYGDLTSLFSGYFDTAMGAKMDMASYQNIAEAIGEPSRNILFLSDVEKELDAARSAGMQTCWVVRDGNPDPQAGHIQVSDFSQINAG